jgi:hypothetical protein
MLLKCGLSEIIFVWFFVAVGAVMWFLQDLFVFGDVYSFLDFCRGAGRNFLGVSCVNGTD